MYEDITIEWVNNSVKGVLVLKNEVEVKGKIYRVGENGIKQSHDDREMEVGKLLVYKYNFCVEMLPDITGSKEQQNIRMADFLLNGVPYEMKRIFCISKNTIKHTIINTKGQAKNVIIDVQNNIDIEQVKEKVIKIYEDKQCFFIDIIVIIENNDVKYVYKRK